MKKKTGLYRGLEWGFFIGGHWDPNDHIPTGFALMAIISQIAIFLPSLAPVFSAQYCAVCMRHI